MTAYDLMCSCRIGAWVGPEAYLEARIPVWVACRLGGQSTSILYDPIARHVLREMFAEQAAVTGRGIAGDASVMSRGSRRAADRKPLCYVPCLVRRWLPLQQMGIRYIGDCAKRTERELLSISGVGKQTVAVIRSEMKSRGLSFRDES